MKILPAVSQKPGHFPYTQLNPVLTQPIFNIVNDKNDSINQSFTFCYIL
jgi:hypothetical protein